MSIITGLICCCLIAAVQTFYPSETSCQNSDSKRCLQTMCNSTALPSWVAIPGLAQPVTGSGSTCHMAPRSRWHAS